METTITIASFSASSMAYIRKLIHIQQHIPHNYRRADQKLVNECIARIKPLVENNRYSDDQARMFWYKYREMIRIIMPTSNYSGFKKLLDEFSKLDENEVWNSLTNNLI
jgi:hypothetical protein